MTVAAGTAGLIEFDHVVIDAAGQRLFVSGKEVHVEPKAFAVLVLLARNANRAVSRDEILDVVWGHRHVTPAVLNRVVALLRHALGENGQDQRWLHTVHGRGYRLDIGQTLPGDMADTATQAAVVPRETALQTQSPPAREVFPSASARPGLRGLVLAAALLVVGAASAVVLMLRTSDAGSVSPSTAQVPRLAILPFPATPDDPEVRASAESLAESLIDRFAHAGRVRTIGRDSIFALARSSADVQKVAAQLDADYVLGGDIALKDERLVVHAVLWRRAETAPVWSVTESVARGQLFQLEAVLADRLGTSFAAELEHPAKLISPAARNLYWLGRHEWQKRTPEALVRALGYFERAAAEDAHYALAWCGVSDAYMLLFVYADLTLDEAARNARAAVAKARAIAPELADIDVSESEILVETDRVDEAIAKLEKVLRAHPDHPLAMTWYGDALERAGRMRDALEWHLNIVDRDPYNLALRNNFGTAYLMTGQPAKAEEEFQRALKLNPGFSDALWNIALLHRVHGELARALDVYEKMQKGPAVSGWTSIDQAYALLEIGDAQASVDLLDHAPGIPMIESLAVKSRALCLLGRCKEALRLIEAYHSQPAQRNDYLAAQASTLLLDGQTEAARAAYAKLFAEKGDSAGRFIRVWLADMNLAVYSSWVAAQAAHTPERAEAMAASRALVERLAQQGIVLSFLTYRKAVLAALDGDAAQAQQLLTSALDGGWLDASALDSDVAWTPYRDSAWLGSIRARIDARVQQERRQLRSTQTPSGG